MQREGGTEMSLFHDASIDISNNPAVKPSLVSFSAWRMALGVQLGDVITAVLVGIVYVGFQH
jgi:hypothetical protein